MQRLTVSTSEALDRFISRVSRRSPLSDDEAAALLALPATIQRARGNADIVSPGELVEQSCLVVDGMLGRFVQMVDGRRQITAMYVAGDMCDLHSVVVPRADGALQALSNVVVLRIPHDDLRRIAKRYPAIVEAFWRDCVVDASIQSVWMANMGRLDAKARMAHLLCEIGTRLEHAGVGKRDRFAFEATQSHLADALGLTPVHVNRTLQDLRSTGFVAIGNRRVEISDWAALAAIAGFDPAYLHLDQDTVSAATAWRHAPASRS
ncbi:MAG: Crp/Fnr family transcriptional regulator [Sphingomonas sp.]